MQTQERKKKIEVRVKFKPRWIVDLENIKVKESFRTTDKSIKEQTQERKKKIKVKTKFKPKWIENLKVKMIENNRRVIPKDRIIRTQDSIPYNRINQQRNRDKKENEIKRDGDGRREEYKNREVSNSLIVNGKTRKRKEKVRRLLRVTHKHNPRIIMDIEDYMSSNEGEENNTSNKEKTWELEIIGGADEENLAPNVDISEREGEQETGIETDIDINDIEQINKIYRKYVIIFSTPLRENF